MYKTTLTEVFAAKQDAGRLAVVRAYHGSHIDARPVGGTGAISDVRYTGPVIAEGSRVILRKDANGAYFATPEEQVSTGDTGDQVNNYTTVIQGSSGVVSGDYVPITRQLIAGDGIMPIGDMSANRTIAVDATVLRTGSTNFVPPERQVIAGAGLTGGGDLSSNITLNVGAGTGIGVTADTVYVDIGDGLGTAANKVVLATPGTLSVSSTNAVGVGTHSHTITTSSAPGSGASIIATDASGHVNLVGVQAGILAVNRTVVGANSAAAYFRSSTLPQIRLEYDAVTYFDLAVDSQGNFLLAPTGDIVIDPGGRDLLPLVNYKTNIGSPSKKILAAFFAEFEAEVIVAREKIATVGGSIGVAQTSTLTRDMLGGTLSYSTITQRGSATIASAAGGGGGYNVITQRGTVTTVTGTGGGQQTITARGSVTTGATDSASSVTVNKPTGVVDGDVMIACVTWWTGTLTAPAGWTQVGTTLSWAASSDTAKMAVYRRTAASEGASYTWTNSSSPNEVYVTIRAYYNVDTTTPIDVSGQNSTTSQGTSVVGNSITTTTTNTMLLFFGSRMDNGINGNAITPDGSMTEISELSAGGGWTRHFVNEQAVAASGATGSRTATSTGNATYGAFMIALRAATGGNTSVSSTKPSGVVDGDHMMALVVKEGSGTLTQPGGWSLLDSQAVAGGTAYVYTKTASSEGSSYTWSLNTTDRLSVHCIAHYNLDGTTKIDANGKQSNASSTSMTSPSVTTVTAETMVVHLGAAIDTSAGSATVTPPSGMAEQSDAGSGNTRLHIASVIQSAAGATGAKTSTLSAPEINAAFTVALRPSAAGGGNTSVAPAKPTGVVNNDGMLAVVAQGGGTLTAPAGWVNVLTQAGTLGTLSVWKKLASGEGSSYTWSLNSTDSLSVSIVAYYNIDTATIVDVYSSQANNSGSTSMTSPGVTPTTPAGMAVFLGAVLETGGGSVTATAPASMNEESDGGAGVVRTYIADQLLASSAATGTKTATLSTSARSAAALVVLKPASSAGGASTTMYLKHSGYLVNQWVFFQDVGKFEAVQVTAVNGVTGQGDYSYTVTRNGESDPGGPDNWYAGAAAFNTGQTGNGWIELYSLYGVQSYRAGDTEGSYTVPVQRAGPTMVMNVRTGTGYNDFREITAVGNLNGLYDYATDIYGFAAGQLIWTGAVHQGTWISMDPTYGFRQMYGRTVLSKWAGGVITLGEDANSRPRLVMSSSEIKFVVKDGSGTDQTKLSILSSGEMIISGNNSQREALFNSSFEYDSNANNKADGWPEYNNGGVPTTPTPSIETDTPFHGTKYQRYNFAVSTSSTAGIQYDASSGNLGSFAWKANRTYILSFYAKAPSGGFIGRTFALAWNTAPSSVVYLLNPAVTTSWQRYAARITWGASVEATGRFYVNFNPSLIPTSGPIDFDAFQVELTTATETQPSPYVEVDGSRAIYPFLGAPTGSGLFISTTAMGYYASGNYLTYIGSNGDFLFRGAPSASVNVPGLRWDIAAGKLRGGYYSPAAGPAYGAFNEQWYTDATTGAIMAGAGKVAINASGISIASAGKTDPGILTFGGAKLNVLDSNGQAIYLVGTENSSFEVDVINAGLTLGRKTGAPGSGGPGGSHELTRAYFSITAASGIYSPNVAFAQIVGEMISSSVSRITMSTNAVYMSGALNVINPYVAMGNRTTTQNIPNATWTPVALDADIIDNYGMTDGTNWTCPVDGYYVIIAKVRWEPHASGQRNIAVYHNQNAIYLAEESHVTVGSGNPHQQTIVAMVNLTTSQSIQIRVWQNSGNGPGLNIGGTASNDRTRVQIFKIN